GRRRARRRGPPPAAQAHLSARDPCSARPRASCCPPDPGARPEVEGTVRGRWRVRSGSGRAEVPDGGAARWAVVAVAAGVTVVLNTRGGGEPRPAAAGPSSAPAGPPARSDQVVRDGDRVA